MVRQPMTYKDNEEYWQYLDIVFESADGTRQYIQLFGLHGQDLPLELPKIPAPVNEIEEA